MIPLGWSDSVDDGMREYCIIPDKTLVEFYIDECESDTQNFRGAPADVWALKLTCTAGNLQNSVWIKVYKDGKSNVWNDLDKNGNPWIQNRFMNLCSAVSLRQSGDDAKINPMWFTNPDCFIDKCGRAVVNVEIYKDKTHNRIQWFNSPSEQQAIKNELINRRVFAIAPVPSSQPCEDMSSHGQSNMDAMPFDDI